MTIEKLQQNLLDGLVRRCPQIGLDKRAEKFVGIFSKDLPEKGRILDIGGAWGFYAAPLAQRGHHVTVVDVRKPAFQKAPVVLYDGKRLPFPDGSFDASLLVTVLHHVADVTGLIREAHRVTRETVVLIEDLYHHRLGRLWTILRDRIYNFQYFGHPCNFKKAEEWIALMEDSGFVLIAREEVFTWLAGIRILNGVLVFRKRGTTWKTKP